MRIFLVATLVYPECLGLFYHRALRALGHKVTVWDPRTMVRQPKMRGEPDLTIVIKEFVDPRILPKPRVYVFPDQTMHENYAVRLNLLTPYYDHVFFCMKHKGSAMRRYRVKLLPFAIDEEIHKPMSTPKNIDVSFVGTNRPGRMELIKYLAEHGVKVNVWGNNWPPDAPNYMGEAIYLEEKRRIYCSSKIVLNHHYLVGVNMRFFEGLGFRCFMLSDRVDGIEELGFNDGVHYVSYDSPQDLVEKIRTYLENQKEREKIASQGYRFVKENHTYQNRVKELLEVVEKDFKRF